MEKGIRKLSKKVKKKEVLKLAGDFSFSGGQIENIARKQLKESILSGNDLPTIESIREACLVERFNTTATRQIGFR